MGINQQRCCSALIIYCYISFDLWLSCYQFRFPFKSLHVTFYQFPSPYLLPTSCIPVVELYFKILSKKNFNSSSFQIYLNIEYLLKRSWNKVELWRNNKFELIKNWLQKIKWKSLDIIYNILIFINSSDNRI